MWVIIGRPQRDTLHLRRVPVERCGGPGVHHTSVNQAVAGDLEDDGGDIVAGEGSSGHSGRMTPARTGFQTTELFWKAPKPTPSVANRSGARPAYARQP